MKKLVYIFVVLLVAGAVSCHRTSETEERLIAIDSLISSTGAAANYGTGASPADSALALLADFDTSSLHGEDCAYHALLTVQAMYKAYIPATSDSIINIAWDYYKDHDIYDRRIRAMLYKGTTAEETGHLDTAMYWYKRTELESRPDDHYHRGYALMNMGYLYQTQPYCNEYAIAKFYDAIRVFSVIGNTHSLISCYMEMGAAYRTVNSDSAIKYLKKALNLASSFGDSIKYYFSLNSIAGLYYQQNKFKECKKYALDVANNGAHYTDSTCFYFASIAYAKLGQLDSAKIMFIKSRRPCTTTDSILYYFSQEAMGNYIVNPTTHLLMSDVITDSIISKSKKTELVKSEMLHSIEQLNVDNKKSSDKVTSMIFVIVFLTSTAGILLFNLSQKKKLIKKAIKTQQELETLVHTINNDVKLTKFQINANNTQTLIFKKLLSVMSRADGKEKIHSIKKLFTPSFFNHIYKYVNERHNNLANKLLSSSTLNEKEANIACLHFCELPNFIIMCYMNITNEHSVTTKKKLIAEKLLGKGKDINDILDL